MNNVAKNYELRYYLLQIARPRPLPPEFLVASGWLCTNFMNNLGISCGFIPEPVSFT